MHKTITHLNFAKGFRGGERQTQLLIEELSEQGYFQKLLVRKKSELGKRCLGVKNLTIIEINKPYIFHLTMVRDSLLLHAHETKAAQFAFFANLVYKLPYIITRRVDNPIKDNFFNKKMYENSFTTVALSKAIENEIHKISPNINTTIIPSAYSSFTINKQNVQQINERFQNKYLIGNIGELDNSHKGQYYLIEAAKILETKYPNMHFLFLGKGKDLANYKMQAQGMNNISFEGFVHNVGDYIACMDLFVFPSLNEGLGSILFDVMQQKVPIIASNVGGIPDIIQDNFNGLLTPPKDINAIVQAIEDLYKDKQKAIKFTQNASQVIENFSKTAMCNKYTVLYKEFL
ncbi:MAG: glycosyltransferase family 4 protein [Helicobacteraceae bacterium]|nr:glycosyltransferase family 4 protein [Helicobacteraceae bacterium]